VTVGDEPTASGRLRSPTVLVAGGVAVVGFLLAAMSTELALAAGEPPVTLLPAGSGIGAILVFRAVAAVSLAAAVRRWRPRRLAAVLSTTGLFWIALGTWQAWLMLART
jgi:hypothetical protein